MEGSSLFLCNWDPFVCVRNVRDDIILGRILLNYMIREERRDVIDS